MTRRNVKDVSRPGRSPGTAHKVALANRKDSKIPGSYLARSPAEVGFAKHLLRMRRRARLAGAAGIEYTSMEKVLARWSFYDFLCRFCGGPAQSTDHRIPLSRGGAHLPANLVPVCISCNNHKHTMTEREYLERKR